jgi:hypothetical protein
MPRSVACLLLSGCLLLIPACSGFPGGTGQESSGDSGDDDKPNAIRPSGGSGLVAQSSPPVADLPVPVGFKLDESKSRNYESSGVRFIDHTYRGRGAVKDAVVKFYRRQMSNKGWNLRGSQMVRGTVLLRYEKGNELCDVRIRSENPPLRNRYVEVTINVQTVGESESSS